jgi:hypothetical protein
MHPGDQREAFASIKIGNSLISERHKILDQGFQFQGKRITLTGSQVI